MNLLVTTGIREGETLQLKVDDVDLQKLTITIARRPDDPEEPRKKRTQRQNCYPDYPNIRAIGRPP